MVPQKPVVDWLEVQGAHVLFLAGELDEEACAGVQAMASGLLSSGGLVVLELSGVVSLYALGISALLDLQRQAHKGGGRLICCGARPFLRELLRISRLDQRLDLQFDLDSALEIVREAS